MRLHLYFFLLCLLLPHYCGAQKAINRYPLTADGKLKYEYMGKLSSGRKLVINFSQKYGFVDSAMNDVVACVYDSATEFENGKALVRKGSKYGIIDTLGKELVPCEYESIDGEYMGNYYSPYSVVLRVDNYAWVTKGGIMGVYTIDAHHYEPMTDYWADYRGLVKKYIRIYSKEAGGGGGLAFRDGKIALAPRKGQSVGSQITNGRIIISYDGKYGFLDSALNVAIPIKYDMVDHFSETLAAVRLYGKWGFIDTIGNLAINICYDTVNKFINGIAIVGRDGKYGAINKAGVEVIPCIYDRLVNDAFYRYDQERCTAGIFPVKRDKRWAFIDTNGNLLSTFRYDNVRVGSGGFVVKENNLFGLISTDFKRMSEIKYTEISLSFSDGCAVVRADKWGALDSNCQQILPCIFADEYHLRMELQNRTSSLRTDSTLHAEPGKYLYVGDFYKGRAAVENSAHKKGYINKNGREEIPSIYNSADAFSNRLTKVKIGASYGYINRRGKYIFGPDTMNVGYNKGIWFALKDQKIGIIDKKGKIITPVDYYELVPLTRNRLYAIKNKRFGIVNAKGKEIVPFIHDNGYEYFNGAMAMKKGNQWLIMNKRGRVKARLDTTLDICGNFHDGLALVTDTSDRYGYINRKGRIVLPCIYNEAKDFNDGGAVVNATVDNYEVITQTEYDDDGKELGNRIKKFHHYGDSVGVVDKKGKLIIPCIYKKIEYYSKTESMPVQTHKYHVWGWINAKNELVVPYSRTWIVVNYHADKHKWKRAIEKDEWVFRNKRGKVKLRVGYVKDPKAERYVLE